MADEPDKFVGDMVIGGRDSPTMADGEGARNMDEIVRLRFIEAKRMEDGTLLRYEVLHGEIPR